MSKTSAIVRRVLAGSVTPQATLSSYYRQRIWLGKAFAIHPDKERQYGRVFVMGKVAHQHFNKRPAVAKSSNRAFHHGWLGLASLGFSTKRHYEAQWVRGMGSTEHIPYGSKVNLTGGYQLGEFVGRPYLRLDIAQGGGIGPLGHLYGGMNLGGFLHKKAVEQGVVKFHLSYFTPLLGVGNQWLRHFVTLDYLAGHNMFTGELIGSSAEGKVALQDPFPGGTQRWQLGLESVLFTPLRLAGCQVAALGFVEAVRLQDGQGKVQQRSFCRVLGVGIRCTHPRFAFGALQAKVGYHPITRAVGLSVSGLLAWQPGAFCMEEPDVILFQ